MCRDNADSVSVCGSQGTASSRKSHLHGIILEIVAVQSEHSSDYEWVKKYVGYAERHDAVKLGTRHRNLLESCQF